MSQYALMKNVISSVPKQTLRNVWKIVVWFVCPNYSIQFCQGIVHSRIKAVNMEMFLEKWLSAPLTTK